MKNIYLENLLVTKSELTDGENRILRFYIKSKKDYGQFVINDICWERELDDMIALLRKAEVKSFVMADESTALLGALHKFLAEGFKIKENVTLTKIEAESWDVQLKGLLIEVVA